MLTEGMASITTVVGNKEKPADHKHVRCVFGVMELGGVRGTGLKASVSLRAFSTQLGISRVLAAFFNGWPGRQAGGRAGRQALKECLPVSAHDYVLLPCFIAGVVFSRAVIIQPPMATVCPAAGADRPQTHAHAHKF